MEPIHPNVLSPSVLQEEMLLPDFYPRKVNIISGLYQSMMVMKECQGYDLGTGTVSAGNRELGVVKRPIVGYDDVITIGWICQKGHTLSRPAEELVKLLQRHCCDVPET